jgi:signal transduction histidine kinase
LLRRHTYQKGVSLLQRREKHAPVKGIYVTGLVLCGGWLLTLKIPEAPILRLLETFTNSGKVEELFLAAAALVALNTVRAIPLYVGCFYFGEGLGRYGGLLPPVIIPLGYHLFALFSGDKGHHFGIPSIMGIVFILQLLIWKVPGRFNRSIALCLFLFSFQWLDLAPWLTPYGFGQGELSLMVKNFAALLDLSPALNLLGFGAFALVFFGALMVTALLVNISLNIRQFRRLMTQNEMLAALREESLRARMANEMQSLVHDLRRPLTSIQGMVDMLAVVSTDAEARGYAECAGAAAENMNNMIGEILHEDGRSRISARELMDYTMSQISPLPWHRHLQTECGQDIPPFYGNKIRISRALANLMENAARAVADVPEPRILLHCSARENTISFFVRDNGSGVPESFALGTSGYGSSGLGLTVVQKVAENHDGAFSLRNHPDGGAEAVLILSLGNGKPGAGG